MLCRATVVRDSTQWSNPVGWVDSYFLINLGKKKLFPPVQLSGTVKTVNNVQLSFFNKLGEHRECCNLQLKHKLSLCFWVHGCGIACRHC